MQVAYSLQYVYSMHCLLSKLNCDIQAYISKVQYSSKFKLDTCMQVTQEIC